MPYNRGIKQIEHTNEGHISIEHKTIWFLFAAFWFNYIPIELVVKCSQTYMNIVAAYRCI